MIDLSVCMIVKNEEKHLERCLKSLPDQVGEIVIVDTGSTDRTMEIASDFTPRVYQHPWQDSFSEARNHALHYANGNKIMQIDADEEVAQASIPQLDAVLSDTEADAYQTPIVSIYPNGRRSMHHFERIFVNGKAHYEHRVHNQVVFDGKFKRTGFGFVHHGYNTTPETMTKKHQRTLRLLKMELADNGGKYDTFLVRYFVQTYHIMRRYNDVVKFVHEHGHIVEDHPGIYQDVMTACMIAHRALDRYHEACKIGIGLLDKYPQALDAAFALAAILRDGDEWQRAAHYYLQYLWTRMVLEENLDATTHYTTWGNSQEAWNGLGACYIKAGHPDKALLAFQRAETYSQPRDRSFRNADIAVCSLLSGGEYQDGAIVQH